MFVKIPATPEDLTVITQVTSEGISVNVTLIFALARYRAVMSVPATWPPGTPSCGSLSGRARSAAYWTSSA